VPSPCSWRGGEPSPGHGFRSLGLFPIIRHILRGGRTSFGLLTSAPYALTITRDGSASSALRQAGHQTLRRRRRPPARHACPQRTVAEVPCTATIRRLSGRMEFGTWPATEPGTVTPREASSRARRQLGTPMMKHGERSPRSGAGTPELPRTSPRQFARGGGDIAATHGQVAGSRCDHHADVADCSGRR
jgi:hypothetical protein